MICILLILNLLHDRGDAIAAATQRGTISGRVVTGAGEVRAVRRARVFLNRVDGAGGATEISDDEGRFSFSDLPAGRYLLGADKAGFVRMNYGETRPGRPGSAIVINDGQLTDLTLYMIPGGVITGTVFDQTGNGASDVEVYLFKAPSGPVSRTWVHPDQKGERTLLQIASGKTDDRGVYRFYGLTPGEYLVGARPSFPFGYISAVETTTAEVERSKTARAPTATAASRRPRPVGYAGVYYPGTADSASAGRVVVTAGQERSGIDIALHLIPLSSVEGRVTWPGNQPKDQRAMVMIVPLSHSPWLADMEFDGAVGSDLTFALRHVVPGRYAVLAQSMIEHPSGISGVDWNAPPRLSAVHELDVSGDVSGIVLALQPGASMSGRIVTEAGTAATQLDRSRLSLMLWPATTRPTVMSPAHAKIDAEGTFAITGISPGTYRLLVRSRSSDPTIVSSAIVNGVNVLDNPVEIKSGDRFPDVVMTLTDQPTELSGAIQDRAGRPASEHYIVVFPVNRDRWFYESRYIQAGRPASDGRYVFRGLPPGDYFMAALTDVEDGEWFDPAFLDALMPAAIKISLGAHEKKVQDIRIGGL